MAFLHNEQGQLDVAAAELKIAIARAEAIGHPDLEALRAFLADVNAAQGADGD